MQDEVFELIRKETKRQKDKIGLIPSENCVSPEVAKVLSSCLSSKYSEGYPKRRYYEGNQYIDEIENLAIERIKQLFEVSYVNVQAYSGSPANSAILMAIAEPGETVMGLKLACGGHLTHGHPKVTFSGKFYNSIQFGLDQNSRIDMDEVEKLVTEHKPKVIIIGTTAYPFKIDFEKFRQAADLVGAYLVADISHIAGLVITDEHPSPVPWVDVVMSTTHKTFRGPRGAMIMVTKRGLEKDDKLGRKIDSAIIPGMQGGPHNATIAGIAIAAAEAERSRFKIYGQQIRENAKVLADRLISNGLNLVGGGTENHLILIDLSSYHPGFGSCVAYGLDVAGIYANRNTIPNEPISAFYPSGLRIGTPLVTTRGMKKREMVKIADWIFEVCEYLKDYKLPKGIKERRSFIREFKKEIVLDKYLLGKAKEVRQVASKFPLFSW